MGPGFVSPEDARTTKTNTFRTDGLQWDRASAARNGDTLYPCGIRYYMLQWNRAPSARKAKLQPTTFDGYWMLQCDRASSARKAIDALALTTTMLPLQWDRASSARKASEACASAGGRGRASMGPGIINPEGAARMAAIFGLILFQWDRASSARKALIPNTQYAPGNPLQ